MRKSIIAIGMCCTFLFTMNGIGYGETTRAKLEAAVKQKQGALQETKKRVSQLESELSILDEKVAENSAKLKESQQRLETQRTYFKKMMVRIYKQVDQTLLAQVFAAGSFSQVLDRIQIIGIFFKEERNILTNYIEAKKDVENALKEMQAAREKQKPLLEKASNDVAVIQKELSNFLHQLEKYKVQDGEFEYYDGSYGTGRFGNPCPGGRLVNNYWEHRRGYCHKGIDIRRPLGSPIVAADSGVVTKMKANPGGYGYYVVVSHGNGLSTLYAHMWRSTVMVGLGQKVTKGQQIAKVGLNGDTTGPHLHFEVRQNGRHVSPMKYLV